jgi:uncharacterized protein YndB with AHSA1/START domain
MTSASDASIFESSRVIAASPGEVFAAIQDPARLARWWGPDGFTNTFDVFEFWPDGRWRFTMHGPNGANYPNESVFRTITPAERVVISHVCPPLFELTISLRPIEAGTLVGWRQEFADPAVAAAVRLIVEPANEQNLDRLTVEVLSGRTGQ